MSRPRNDDHRRPFPRLARTAAWLLCGALLVPGVAGARGARTLVTPGTVPALEPPKPTKPPKAAKGAPAAKGAAAAPRTGLENLERQIQSFTLANGLRFIVVERHAAPVFSFETVVNSGSAADGLGTTGLAHMMEHMAFKGTAIVGTKDYAAEQPLLEREEAAFGAVLEERRRGAHADSTRLRSLEKSFADAQTASHALVVSNEFQKVIEQAGAQNWNASTHTDFTDYFYSLPSNRLELWALMEGGRMGHPVFREFYKERDVVYEERRMRTESSPIGRLIDEFIHASYVAHPYGFGGIGYPSDLKSFTRTQGEEFFRRHYVAKNMTVAIVGDVTTTEVKAVAEKYFGDLSDAPLPPPIDTVEPEQRAERRVILEDAAQPLVFIGWHVPAATDPRYPAYEALADLLGGGDWARLQKTLVKEKKIAVRIQCGTGFPGEKYPNQLVVLVVPASGQDPLKVEQAVYDALDEVRTTRPLTDEELAGYKVRVRADKIETATDNAQLAGTLAQAQALYGDWHEFFRGQERVQALTTADLMDALKRSLLRSNRTVGLIVNPAPAAAGQGGRRP
jgi:predicted Zn-dependent peptidase